MNYLGAIFLSTMCAGLMMWLVLFYYMVLIGWWIGRFIDIDNIVLLIASYAISFFISLPIMHEDISNS